MADIVMPKLGLTMTEGTIAAWYRQPGETFVKGDILFEVETEKVTNEIEAASNGQLETILHAEGSVVLVGEPIARMMLEGEAPTQAASAPLVSMPENPTSRHAPSARKLMAEHDIDPASVVGSGRDGRIMKGDILRVIATPLARRIARDTGKDLQVISGTGPAGRIKAADVLAAQPAAAPTPNDVTHETTSPKITVPDALRMATARRVQAAKRDIPHFYVSRDVNAGPLLHLRASLNAETSTRQKMSVTHLLVKALGLALHRHPALNSIWLPDGIMTLPEIGVGIVTETPGGLRIPVLNGADHLPLDTLAATCGVLLDRARTGRLRNADVSGGAISISNVGMFGAGSLTPIIGPPQAMILGVGAEQQAFRPAADGNPELRREINLTLAADHRLIDGADAARFLSTLTELLENPLDLLRAPESRQTL
ncbi:dihydrolipoamide acetyltransferase family protein [Agrobacterium sp. OT33]|uniref:dihydrolipoamide acetyltransferase family protein n=1 Tax=Agrobacterium sp. OT33 TaxID=2815338 RepID=UPI001A8D40BB|nr:dihydrolipoamide acetyltransferase family protein [Agrobacterium sp. OT33]MBO0128513.1 2-oxo acid dehydrogenase subunit E2 [Agrobacterium sp. OT33]